MSGLAEHTATSPSMRRSYDRLVRKEPDTKAKEPHMDATDTSLLVEHHSETEDAGCACLCAQQSASPTTNTDDADEVGELQARRATIEQRLAMLAGRVAGNR